MLHTVVLVFVIQRHESSVVFRVTQAAGVNETGMAEKLEGKRRTPEEPPGFLLIICILTVCCQSNIPGDPTLNASLVAQTVKHLPVTREIQVPSLGQDGEGNGNPLQYSCLENPMDGGGC